MAFREFLVAVLLAVTTQSYEVRRTQGRPYIDQVSNRATQRNVYSNDDAKPFVLTQNNYDGNGPKTQVNYRSAVQNNFGSSTYNHYPNLRGNSVGKRQEGRQYYGIQNNYGQDETHGHDGHANIPEKNPLDGFWQFNSNSHVVNNFGGISGPDIPDKSTRDHGEKPRGSGGELTFVQHNVNSPVTHVYPKKPVFTPQSDPNFRGTKDNGDNLYAVTNSALRVPRDTIVRINEDIRNKLADAQRHLDDAMDTLRTHLGKIPHYFNDNNNWSVTPTYYFNPGRSATGNGSGGTHYIDNDDNTLRNGNSNGGANREESPVHSVEPWEDTNDGGSGIPDGQSIRVGGTNNKNYPRKNDGGSAAIDPRRSDTDFSANDPRRSDGGPYPGTTYRPLTQYNGNGNPVYSRRRQGGRPQIEMDVNNVDGYSSNSKW